MRRTLAVLLLCACGPSPRNLGDPTGQSRQQDQQGEAPLALGSSMPEAGPWGFSVLVANVGNIDVFRCDSAIYKLCAADQEARIAARIAALKPDVALLAETLNPAQCEALSASVPDWHVYSPTQPPGDQVRRLLGPDYTIACEPRRGYECLAVRSAFACLEGCSSGALCRGLSRTVDPVPGCDDGFTLSAVTARIDGVRVDLMVGHPPSGFAAADAECRRAYLPGALAAQGEETSLRSAPFALFGGDLNLDPWRNPGEPDTAYFRAQVGLGDEGGAAFRAHSGPVENDPPWWTSPLVRRSLDHVVTEGFVGRCVTLGAHEGYPPLDLAQGPDIQRLDHLAQYCVLELAR